MVRSPVRSLGRKPEAAREQSPNTRSSTLVRSIGWLTSAEGAKSDELEFQAPVADWLLLAAVVIGVALRSAQYLADTSLWLDEIALVRGILELDLRELATGSLPYDQIAPIGFLVAQKGAIHVFGPSDSALRLIP